MRLWLGWAQDFTAGANSAVYKAVFKGGTGGGG